MIPFFSQLEQALLEHQIEEARQDFLKRMIEPEDKKPRKSRHTSAYIWRQYGKALAEIKRCEHILKKRGELK